MTLLTPKYDFLGFKVDSPFGFIAGPLINGNFIQEAFNKGFDICVYKTVRTRAKKANQQPFGDPSQDPKIWQAEISKLVKWANEKEGKIVCGMIEGTRWDDSFTEQDFLNDWVLAARLMKETKVHVIEANFSCSNGGNGVKQLLCFDVEQSRRIAEAIKEEIGNIPLVIELPYFEDEYELRIFIQELGRIVDGFSAISTMVKRLKKLREKMRYQFTIIGVGEVTTPDDFFEYQKAGADIVMTVTGAIWNPQLVQEIKEKLEKSVLEKI